MAGLSETGSSHCHERLVVSVDDLESTQPALETSDAKTRQRDLAVRLSQARVADIIGLLMRSERHRRLTLADLEWLLLPPLLLNQIMLSYVRPHLAKQGAVPAPSKNEPEPVGELPPMAVAMVSWALVSPEVDAKIDAQLKSGSPCRLDPNDWRSGDIPRVIDMVGQQAAISDILMRVADKFPQLRGDGKRS